MLPILCYLYSIYVFRDDHLSLDNQVVWPVRAFEFRQPGGVTCESNLNMDTIEIFKTVLNI